MTEADDTQATLTGEPSLEPLKTLAAAARAETVFSAPVTAGDYTVITASEGMMGMGFGYGSGSQSEPGQGPQEGGGGGGGGFQSQPPGGGPRDWPGGSIRAAHLGQGPSLPSQRSLRWAPCCWWR